MAVHARARAGSIRVGQAVAVAAMLALSAAAAPAADVLVFAAASMKNALEEIGAAYGQATGGAATFAFAASSALARQIESGAPADIFVSADRNWMDHLETRNRIRPETRVDLVGNRLVLIAPQDDPTAVTVEKGFDLGRVLGDRRLAVADPDAVPAGRYAKAALVSLGAWDDVAGRLARAENVRAALMLVSRGEAPFGIVYETDAKVDDGVRIVDRFPVGSHPEIVYPVAVTAESRNPDAPAFLAFLRSPEAAAIFEKHGFTTLTPAQ